jgi:hypothetical protein
MSRVVRTILLMMTARGLKHILADLNHILAGTAAVRPAGNQSLAAKVN